MFLAFVIAAAAASGSPSPSTGADRPLREVVYHVSYTRHERLNEVSFGGGADPRPAVQGADQTDEGTITVDVMAVASDNLAVKLTESWNQHPRPATYYGNVTPDGIIHFDQPISEESTILLPIFGPKWMHDQPLDIGAKWDVDFSNKEFDGRTTYQVSAAQVDTVTITEAQTVTVHSVHGLDSFATGTITYKADKLVPLAIKVERRSSRGDADNSDYETMVINIERVSDTLDPSN